MVKYKTKAIKGDLDSPNQKMYKTKSKAYTSTGKIKNRIKEKVAINNVGEYATKTKSKDGKSVITFTAGYRPKGSVLSKTTRAEYSKQNGNYKEGKKEFNAVKNSIHIKSKGGKICNKFCKGGKMKKC